MKNTRVFAPPPTKFGTVGQGRPLNNGAAQLKPASALASPPVSSAMVPSPVRTIQKMDTNQDTLAFIERIKASMSIGEAKNFTNQIASIKSTRQLELALNPFKLAEEEVDTEEAGRIFKDSKKIKKDYYRVRPGDWDGSTRPAWYEETWTSLALNKKATTVPKKYRCCVAKCTNNGRDIYRLKDRAQSPTGNAADDATIDHKISWKDYIYRKAGDGGGITKGEARRAYNDVRNLQIMCRSCNARKNGPKNVFD